MGLLENQRRKRHELSLDWNELVMMMLLDHELDVAERDGVPEHVRTQTATRIRDAVVARVGQPGIVRVFIDTDYEMRTPDKDAVVVRALVTSGYEDARRDLPAEVLAPVAAGRAAAAGPRWDDEDDIDARADDEPVWDDEPDWDDELELEAEPVPAVPFDAEPVREPASSPLPGVAVEDAEAYDVAKRAVEAWRDRFPHVVEQAETSDGGRTTPAVLVAEGYTAARSARGTVDRGDAPITIFERQSSIAFDQAERGVTKEWVVAFMQIRCIATGYMLHALGHDAEMKEFGRLFREFFDA
jgi:hypothetical protein